MDIKDLEKLIKEELVSNRQCSISKQLIKANEGYYVIPSSKDSILKILALKK